MTHDDMQSNGEPNDSPADPISALLAQALAEPPTPRVHFLPGIQERIRLRTRGRYFSKRREAFRDPIILVLMVAMLILMLGTMAFFALEPLMSPDSTPSNPPGAPSDGPGTQLGTQPR